MSSSNLRCWSSKWKSLLWSIRQFFLSHIKFELFWSSDMFQDFVHALSFSVWKVFMSSPCLLQICSYAPFSSLLLWIFSKRGLESFEPRSPVVFLPCQFFPVVLQSSESFWLCFFFKVVLLGNYLLNWGQSVLIKNPAVWQKCEEAWVSCLDFFKQITVNNSSKFRKFTCLVSESIFPQKQRSGMMLSGNHEKTCQWENLQGSRFVFLNMLDTFEVKFFVTTCKW